MTYYSIFLQLYPNRLSFIILFITVVINHILTIIIFFSSNNYFNFLPLLCTYPKYKQYGQKISGKSFLHISSFSGYT